MRSPRRTSGSRWLTWLTLALLGCGTPRNDSPSTGAAGACTEDTQCADDAPCTLDHCDVSAGRCVHEPDTLCLSSLPSGEYALSPPPSYECRFLTLAPLSALRVVVGPRRMQVFGLPSELIGESPRDGRFELGVPLSTGRAFRLRLEATLRPPDAFDGTIAITCTDCLEADGCPPRTLSFRATRR